MKSGNCFFLFLFFFLKKKGGKAGERAKKREKSAVDWSVLCEARGEAR